MSKYLRVRSLGLLAISITLLSGFYLFIKSRNTPATILVPLDRAVLTQLNTVLPNINAPAAQPPPNNNPLPANHGSVNIPDAQPSPNKNPLPPNPVKINSIHNNNNIALGPPPNLNIPGNNPGSDNDRHGDTNQGERDEDEFDLEVPVPDQGDSKELLQQLQDDKMVGMMNFDLWGGFVGYYVDDLRTARAFPNRPTERTMTDKLHIDFKWENEDGRYGHKVYGYLIPPEKGEYQFQIKMTELTAAAAIELWLSDSSSPLDMRKILVLDYDDLDRPVKRYSTTKDAETKAQLSSPVHYFEYLMKAFEGIAVVDILWKIPGSDSFVPIPSSSLAMAVKLDSDGEIIKGAVSRILKGPLPSNLLQTHHRAYYVGNVIYPITGLDVLPQCEFNAVYAHVRRVKAYTGVHQVKESLVYPKDDTWFKNWQARDKGNAVIDKETADKVVSLYKKALNVSKKQTGRVSQLINLEETKNGEQGSRFLLELMIELHNPSELINTSEYVFLPKGEDRLCHTSNFQWKTKVDVHLVVTVKNLGFWIQHLMQNMEEIFEATQDEHFRLIVIDYQSEDVDVEELMGRSSFKNWDLIRKEGAFSRSAGLQAGIDSVKDLDSIVMTIDMHLTLPTGFVEAIRRHTIQGKMAYTPFFFRLNKGFTEVNYNGFWETLTYGIFGLFKSDWRNMGGFNLRKYRDKWGGEDWDILDRTLARGYEAFRIRVPGLVHYHHTKAGMWGGKTKG